MKKRIACFLPLVLIMGVFSAFAATIWRSAPQEKDKTAEVLAQQLQAKDNTVQAPAQQPGAKNSLPQAQAPPEEIVAGPQNIKERTAIYVFIAWLWAAIIVLIYILRLEIKEADRLLDIRFYPGEEI